MTESLHQIMQNWKELLKEQELAFQLCVDLDGANPESNPEKSEAVRNWWKLTSNLLWMFARVRAEYGHDLSPFPAELFGRLAKISEEIGNGIVPTLVEDARLKGGRPLFAGERRHIAYGVLYIEAVRRGEIVDRSPNKTVRQAYGVTAKTVQNWVKDRDRICAGVPFNRLCPEQLAEKMYDCAEVYLRIGRGAPSEN